MYVSVHALGITLAVTLSKWDSDLVMVQCGNFHKTWSACIHYVICAGHILRSVTSLQQLKNVPSQSVA